MMQFEFEGLTGKQFTEEEWIVIETVYAWHPAIADRQGKQQIATLFSMGGMSLLREMLPMATRFRGYEEDIAKAEHEALVASGQHGAASRKADKINRWATQTAPQYTEALRAANGFAL